MQDLASAIDEEDVAKFTEVVKEFDSMTRLVCPLKHWHMISFFVQSAKVLDGDLKPFLFYCIDLCI